MDENDLDYIRSAIELDKDFAIKTLPCLRLPRIQLYWIEGEGEQKILRSGIFNREGAIDIIMNKNVVGF